MIILINKENYSKCDEFSRAMWANTKAGTSYNRGFINSAQDPYKVERIGCLGEMALSLYLGVLPDFEYAEGGKKSDFIINGFTIDIKTCAEQSKYKISLLRCTSDNGKYIKPTCDIYVSAYLDSEADGIAQVVLVGWHLLARILEQKMLPSRRKYSRHKNYELRYEDTFHIGLLKDYINGKEITKSRTR